MPLVEITDGEGALISEEKLRLTRVVQGALVEEYHSIKGRTPKTWVFVRELDMGSLLIDGMSVTETRAQAKGK